MNSSGLVSFYIPDPNQQVKGIQKEIQNQFNIPDPDKPPRKDPGDVCVVVGAILGVIAGTAIGYFLCVNSGVSFILTLGGGIIIGGLIGTFIGELIKRHRRQ